MIRTATGSVDFTVTEDRDHGTASWTSVAIIAPDGSYTEKGNVTFGKCVHVHDMSMMRSHTQNKLQRTHARALVNSQCAHENK